MAQRAREAAFEALMGVEVRGAYSNILLGHLLSREEMPGREKALASRLFYGVLEKQILLDYNLTRYAQRPLREVEPGVRVLLRLGLYQLLFVQSIPPSAAVNESVRLCREKGFSRSAGFVNGILRAAAREGRVLLPEQRKGKMKYLSVRYSCPEKLVRLWRDAYGEALLLWILQAIEGQPPLFLRVNPLKTTAEALRERLGRAGHPAENCPGLPNALCLREGGGVEQWEAYREGLFHVQDFSSQLCCRMLGAKPGETVLDVCAAPGGKSFTIAEEMENRGQVFSGDLYAHRLQLVETGAARLGLTAVQTVEADAGVYEGWPMADRILCDVPCSGLGIIRRKPELMLKEDLGLESLPPVQYRILCRSASFLKPGGVLVYSTCTLHPAENEAVIARFLEEHPAFSPRALPLPEGVGRMREEEPHCCTLFPMREGGDGFFIASVRRDS